MLGFQLHMFLGVAWVKASIFFSLEPDGFITSKKMQPGSLKGRWEGRPHPISIGLQGEKLTSSICTVAIVGRKDNGTIEPFEMIDVKRIQEIIESMEEVPPGPMMTCSWAVHHHQFWVTVLESWVVTRPCSQVSTSLCSTNSYLGSVMGRLVHHGKRNLLVPGISSIKWLSAWFDPTRCLPW
jgi:hypothetical protein